MKLVAILLVAVSALTAATPVADAANRKKTDMVLCRREDYDDCTVFKGVERDTCINVPSSMNQRIRSITFYHSDQCTFYTDKDCLDNPLTDAGNLPDLKKKYRDKINSYNCE